MSKLKWLYLKDSGAFLESRYAGLTKVTIQCSESYIYDFTNYTWGYQVYVASACIISTLLKKNIHPNMKIRHKFINELKEADF